MNCLLIDDDIDDQEIFLLCLNDVNPEVKLHVAKNGVEALLMLRADKDCAPGVIFLDVNMPKMNGLECLSELKSLPQLSNTPIYVYSTTSEESVVKKAEELGAKDYIIKPTKADKLIEILKTIFAV